MIALARITKGMHIVDLGSGDGRLLFLAAEKGAMAVGYEINPILVLYTLMLSFLNGHQHLVHVYWKNLWSADIKTADVVFVYLLPWKMNVLQSILEQKLKPGALVVTNTFIFPKWQIMRQDKINHIYVFKR